MFSRRKRRVNRAIKILLLADGLTLVAGAMLGPIYALFVEKIGGDLLDASLTGMIFALVGGFTVLIAGRYSDRLKQPKHLIITGYALSALGFFGYLFVGSIWQLLVIQIILGFGEAIRSPAYDGIYSRHLDKKKEATEWGAWESTYYFTSAFGAVVGGYLASEFGFDYIFVIMAVLSFAAAAYIYSLPRKLL
mgnify:CR=1 FL=1